MRTAHFVFRVAIWGTCCILLSVGDVRNTADELKSLGVTESQLRQEAAGILDWIVALRRQLHQRPELQYSLSETTKIVRKALDDIGVLYNYPVAESGIVGTIGTGQEPVVALRADMDALPIQEADLKHTASFKSQNDGRMHACGHDGHVAMLLGAAKLLKRREESLRGSVRLIFQPAEEGGAGALMMAQQGVLGSPPVQRVFAMHVWPWLPSGAVAVVEGPVFAAAGEFEAVIRGNGGHAACGIGAGVTDPLVPAAAILTALQSVVSRDVSPRDEAVLSVTMLHAGEAFNVVPSKVTIGGTIRAFKKETYLKVEQRMRAVMGGIAAAHGCTVEVVSTGFDDDCLQHRDNPFGSMCAYPPAVNDPAMAVMVQHVAGALFGADTVANASPTMGGEDFAYFAERVPGALAYLGIANASKGSDAGLHTPHFQLDEEVLDRGAALHAMVALRSLSELSGTETSAPAAPSREL